MQPVNRSHEQLAQAGALERQIQPDQPKRRRMHSENGRPGAEWPHHFIVPHIYNPEVPLMTGALAGDGTDGVRIDRRHRDTDHLKVRGRKTPVQKRFQITASPISRIGIAQRGGFTKQENAIGVGGLHCVHHHRSRTARLVWRKEFPTKPGVLNKHRPTADLSFQKNWSESRSRQDASPLRRPKALRAQRQASRCETTSLASANSDPPTRKPLRDQRKSMAHAAKPESAPETSGDSFLISTPEA